MSPQESLRAPLVEAPEACGSAGSSAVARPMTVTERGLLKCTTFPAECGAPAYGFVLNGALFFRRLPLRSAAVEDFSRVLLAHLRFRSLAREDGTWEPTTVDPDYHFVDEPAVADTASARRRIEELVATDLERSRPLWRLHLIPVKAEGAFSVVLWRVHHCIGDGSTLSPIFNSLACDAEGKPVGETPLMKRLAEELARRRETCRVAKACHSVAMGADAVRSFFSLASMPYRPLETDTMLSRSRAERRAGNPYGGPRHVVYVPAHSLAYVKACKSAARTSLNDVVFSATTGALRRYCELHGDPAFQGGRRVRLRALVPIAVPETRQGAAEDSLSNNFSFVSCRMAVSETSPLERLQRTHAEMSRLKNSTKALVSHWQINRMAQCFAERQRQKIARDLFANHSLVFSNVPGPDAPVHIAGEKLEEIQVIYPQLLPQVILLSYNGRIHMNFTVDPALIEDADSLADCYIAELRAIGAGLGVAGDPLECPAEAPEVKSAPATREAAESRSTPEVASPVRPTDYWSAVQLSPTHRGDRDEETPCKAEDCSAPAAGAVEAPEAHAEAVAAPAATPTAGEEAPKAAEEAPAATDEASTVAEEARAVTEVASLATEEPRAASEEARAASEEACAATEEAHATAEGARATTEEAHAAGEEARAAAEEPRAAGEEARAVTAGARAAGEEAHPASEKPPAAADGARAATEEVRAVVEEARAATEEARAATEETPAASEVEETPAASEEELPAGSDGGSAAKAPEASAEGRAAGRGGKKRRGGKRRGPRAPAGAQA